MSNDKKNLYVRSELWAWYAKLAKQNNVSTAHLIREAMLAFKRTYADKAGK